ncbi:hypothetical protein ABT369_33215 [Dactylosporangium sp. NPDC000244]|uniref:hypothetical protein n=1 Tax=Dactylosporangium sp. NPDC000244 TaxID=3154365 RepID=UPI0033208EF5
MGFWGTYVVLRSDEPPAQVLPAITALQGADSRDGAWSAGWRVWVVRDSAGSLPDDLLEQLHAVTGAPVLLGRVLDSSAVHVVATGTSVRLWEAWLQLKYAMGYLLDPPAPFDDDGNYLGDGWSDPAYEAKVELTRSEILAQAPGGMAGASSAQAWARDAGLVPDAVEAIASVLDGRETFAEDLFLQLLQRLGLNPT